ncbi:hypothetical protein, partial [Rhizobium rhizogenes]|uniref:hypothetical protein n=1 Tax=Rhizobium rhizogenes TaxID=359 RepID=UPI001AED6AB0
AHNLKAAGSNPAPATNLSKVPVSESPHRGLFAFLYFNRPGAAHQCFQDCLLVEKLEFLLARCEGKDRGKTTAQYDRQFCPIGYEIDTAVSARSLSAACARVSSSPSWSWRAAISS